MGCVYVAVSVAGIIKVGATKNPEGRLPGLKAAYKKFGDAFLRIEYCDNIENYVGAEYGAICAIERVAQPYFGREWFEGVSFEAALEIAKKATDARRRDKVPKELSPKQRAKRDAEIAAKKFAEDERKLASKIAYEARNQDRKRIRAIRYAQIAEVAARHVGGA